MSRRILVVSSPHAYTTRDVWKRVLVGLEAQPGVEVTPYDLLPRYNMWDFFLEQARKKKFELPASFGTNTLACEPVMGAAVLYDCDTVLIVSPQYFPMSVIQVLRKVGIKTAAYFTEAPYEDTLNAPTQASFFDYVFVNDRNSVGLFKTFCPNTYYLPHSFDPALHYPDLDGETDGKVIFTATGYPSRRQFLQQVDWEGIDLELRGLWWMPARSKLKKYVRGEVQENEDVAEMYRHATAGISMHRQQRYVDERIYIDSGEAYSVGPRTYELAACGLFQVSDHRDELADIFGEGVVPVYDTPREMGDLIRKALADEPWRQELRGRQVEAMAHGHSCKERMRIVVDAMAA